MDIEGHTLIISTNLAVLILLERKHTANGWMFADRSTLQI